MESTRILSHCFKKECEFRFNYGTPMQQPGNVEAVV
jgi:hypothetical protein